MSSVELDAVTGAWKWVNPATSVSYFYDSHQGAWKFERVEKSGDWRWAATNLKTSKPTPAPRGAKPPAIPAFAPQTPPEPAKPEADYADGLLKLADVIKDEAEAIDHMKSEISGLVAEVGLLEKKVENSGFKCSYTDTRMCKLVDDVIELKRMATGIPHMEQQLDELVKRLVQLFKSKEEETDPHLQPVLEAVQPAPIVPPAPAATAPTPTTPPKKKWGEVLRSIGATFGGWWRTFRTWRARRATPPAPSTSLSRAGYISMLAMVAVLAAVGLYFAWEGVSKNVPGHLSEQTADANQKQTAQLPPVPAPVSTPVSVPQAPAQQPAIAPVPPVDLGNLATKADVQEVEKSINALPDKLKAEQSAPPAQPAEAPPAPSAPSSPLVEGDDAARLAKLNDLLAWRAQKLLGPGPAGLRYDGYHQVEGTSPENPCKPGFHAIGEGRTDPATRRVFFRCESD